MHEYGKMNFDINPSHLITSIYCKSNLHLRKFQTAWLKGMADTHLDCLTKRKATKNDWPVNVLNSWTICGFCEFSVWWTSSSHDLWLCILCSVWIQTWQIMVLVWHVTSFYLDNFSSTLTLIVCNTKGKFLILSIIILHIYWLKISIALCSTFADMSSKCLMLSSIIVCHQLIKYAYHSFANDFVSIISLWLSLWLHCYQPPQLIIEALNSIPYLKINIPALLI